MQTEREKALGDVASVAEQVAKKYHKRAFPDGSTSTADVTGAAISAAFADFAAVLRAREGMASVETELKYPDGGLPPQRKDFADTFKGATALKDALQAKEHTRPALAASEIATDSRSGATPGPRSGPGEEPGS